MRRMALRTAAAVSDTRAAVIGAAVRSASITGLEGLTIGTLADALEMRKSGLFGLFGSKQELQIATLEAGTALFLREVWAPVAGLEPGRERLLALCDRWLELFEGDQLPGGCLMTTAIVEFDARPGPVRTAVADVMQLWHELLAHEVRTAVDAGQLPAKTEPVDVAFQLNALASAASTSYHLTGKRDGLDQARRIMAALLSTADTSEGVRIPPVG
jgi:AcrR family transcriptional regulator